MWKATQHVKWKSFSCALLQTSMDMDLSRKRRSQQVTLSTFKLAKYHFGQPVHSDISHSTGYFSGCTSWCDSSLGLGTGVRIHLEAERRPCGWRFANLRKCKHQMHHSTMHFLPTKLPTLPMMCRRTTSRQVLCWPLNACSSALSWRMSWKPEANFQGWPRIGFANCRWISGHSLTRWWLPGWQHHRLHQELPQRHRQTAGGSVLRHGCCAFHADLDGRCFWLSSGWLLSVCSSALSW